jgi:hypothetical protein
MMATSSARPPKSGVPAPPSDAPFGGQDYYFQKGMQQNNFSENVTKIVDSGMNSPRSS